MGNPIHFSFRFGSLFSCTWLANEYGKMMRRARKVKRGRGGKGWLDWGGCVRLYRVGTMFSDLFKITTDLGCEYVWPAFKAAPREQKGSMHGYTVIHS